MANSLAHSKWVCKYHVVFTPKYRRESNAGPYPSAAIDSTEVFRVELHGISEGETPANIALGGEAELYYNSVRINT